MYFYNIQNFYNISKDVFHITFSITFLNFIKLKEKGKGPATKEDTTLTNINGLGLYNSGDTPLENKGDMAILRATFVK